MLSLELKHRCVAYEGSSKEVVQWSARGIVPLELVQVSPECLFVVSSTVLPSCL